MPNTNDFTTWATAVGANVLTAAAYSAASIRQQGAQVGIADPVTFNNMARQASVAATMIAQFTADWGPSNVVDDGNVVTLEAQFIAALSALIASIATGGGVPQNAELHYGVDTGIANAYVVATPTPTITSLSAGLVVLVKFANANTGASTANIAALGVKDLKRVDLTALQLGDIKGNEIGILIYDGTQWQLASILPTSLSVPVATTTSNGIARQATTTEASTGVTTGSVPAFITPEELAGYGSGGWTAVVRTASHTETVQNEIITIEGSSNWTITLVDPTGKVGGYIVFNSSASAKTLTSAGNFYGSDLTGDGTNAITIPAWSRIYLMSDDFSYQVVELYMPATTSNRGLLRVASNTEGTNGVTTGDVPAAMTPEDVALYFAAHVANTSNRGIARQANTAEMTDGATYGSTPAFVTPEGVSLFWQNHGNPFLATGVGALMIGSYMGPLYTYGSTPGSIGTWSSTTSHTSGMGPVFGSGNVATQIIDQRWPNVGDVPAGTWELISWWQTKAGFTLPTSSYPYSQNVYSEFSMLWVRIY